MAALRDRWLADRTIFNRMSTVLTFLRSFGVEGLLSRRDLPRYTKKSVDAYGEAEIAQLLRAGNEKSRVICGFFLGTEDLISCWLCDERDAFSGCAAW